MSELKGLAVVLAAGEGTRMRSSMPKVLHAIAGRSLLGHVMAGLDDFADMDCALVVGPGMEAAEAEAKTIRPDVSSFVQSARLGTAHATLAARSAIESANGPVLVLYGDTPLLGSDTLRRVLGAIEEGADVVVLGFEPADPDGYGRLLLDASGALTEIREHRDASQAERAVRLCNSGVMAFRSDLALDLLAEVGNDNAKGEYYLTDTVAIARAKGLQAAVIVCDEGEVAGVNDRMQLARLEAAYQARKRAELMRRGVTMIAPETVILNYDTEIASDTLIEPFVVFGPGVSVAEGATIRSFSHLESAEIGEGAVVGPYARLRPGSEIGPGAKIGNFVETKNARIEPGAKVNHLTYIGDARIGAGANIGAGTITCNYDGFAKNHTDIGEGAFIGSNSALVAPVKIGDGAYIGSGSVISRDVESGSLAVTRSEQREMVGWAERMRRRRENSKAKSGR